MTREEEILKSKGFNKPLEFSSEVYEERYKQILSAIREYAREMSKTTSFSFAKFLDDGYWRRNKASNMWFNNNFEFLTEDETWAKYLEHLETLNKKV